MVAKTRRELGAERAGADDEGPFHHQVVRAHDADGDVGEDSCHEQRREGDGAEAQAMSRHRRRRQQQRTGQADRHAGRERRDVAREAQVDARIMLSRHQQTGQGQQRETEADLRRDGGDERRGQERDRVGNRNGGPDDHPGGVGGNRTERREVETGVQREAGRRCVQAKRRVEREVRDLFVQHGGATP